jgi:putative two-component system response regulator
MGEKLRSVFLVDDNPVNLKIGRTVLQDNYAVLTIPSGDKLLAVLKKNKPDLILLDVEMPGMSGYDVIKEIKADPETTAIPVIFLTGKTEPENERMGRSLGAVDYICKPFSPPQLLEKIALYLHPQQG